MGKERYYKFLDDRQEWVIRDRRNRRKEYRVGRNKRYAEKLVDLLNSLIQESEELDMENATLLSERIIDLEMFEEVADKLKSFAKENEQLKTEVKHWKHQCKELLESHSEYDEDLGICCMCENLEGIYMEQYHEAEYHCKIDGFKVERQKELCEKFKIK